MLLPLLLCGIRPSSPLAGASLVTGATGHGVASPQKSSALNKSPNIAGGFHFIQRLRAALKEVLLPHKKGKKKTEKEVVTQWSSGSVQIFLCCYLTWQFFLFLPLRHPSLYSLSSEILMVLRSFCLDCLAAAVSPSGSKSGL